MNLRESVPEQYRVTLDDKTSSIWILDCWHKTIENLDPENYNVTNIDPESPAVTILNKEQINALIGGLIKLGWLDKIIDNKVYNNPKVINTVVEPIETLQSKAIASIVELIKINSAVPTDERTVQEAISSIRELGKKT